MQPELKADADALWGEAMGNVGRLERGALARRGDMIYELFNKHFGPTYAELAALKERLASLKG